MIQRSVNQKQNNSPVVAFFFKSGQSQALGISMSPPMALAAADVFEFIGKKCLELEYARGPIGAQTGAYQNPGFVPSTLPPEPSQIPPGTGKVANNFAGAFDNFMPDNDTPF